MGSNANSGALVEQRVAPGDHHDVDVAGHGEPGREVGVVDTDTDRPDDPLVAEPAERRHGLLHRRFDVVVGVVDEGDVDAVEPEAVETVVERATHTVGTEVPQSPRGST